MYPKQRGITMIGWLVLLVPLAIVGYAAIRMAPVYLNYMKVVRSMEQTAKELAEEDNLTVTQIRNALGKHLIDVESVEFPKIEQIMIRRNGPIWQMQASYEDTAPLFLNLAVLSKFDKTVDIK
jgi:hypothetical protein